MARPFQPTESKKLFVGRERELKQITGILDSGKPAKWLIQIHGDGGIGKTRLLESLRDEIKRGGRKKMWRCTDLIDFYKTSNRTTFGLLAEMARQLGRESFPQFEKQREASWEVLTTNPDPSLYQDAVHRVTNAFFEDWRKLLQDGAHLLLLFDTCEEMHDLAAWVMQTLLPELLKIQQEIQADSTNFHLQTVTVWAGRDPLPFPEECEKYLLSIELAPLSLAEVKEFFKLAHWFPRKIKLAQLEQLNIRCGGRPLYVALSCDWLKNGAGVIDDLLGNHIPFEEKLISWISPLKDLPSDAILNAALAWQRMEAGLLAKLLAIAENEARSLLQELGEFSFVKYRPPEKSFEGSFQLHDEMRDLVKQRFWMQASDLTVKKRLQEIIDWYKTRIGKPELLAGKERPKTDEERAMLAEYVYYQCERDPNAGSQAGECLFKRSIHYVDLAFCELLNHEISRFEDKLSNARKDQLRFQQALVAFRKDDYAWANQLWHSLLRRPDCDEKLKGTCLMMLVESQSYTGDYQEALAHAEEAEKIYTTLLQQSDPEKERRNLIVKELGQLYHNWGYAYRVKGQLDEALKYYEKSLERGGTEKNIARILNNIGYVHFLHDDTEKAVTYVGKALQIRHDLGIAYELGLGSNTLGMIMEGMGRIDDAADLYRKAYNYFEAAGSDRGLALVQISLGRLMRVTNNFGQALEYLLSAAGVLEKKGDTAYLIVALNEIGCAYRQQATAEAQAETATREQAAKYLQQSLELGKQINNYQAIADNLDDLQILHYQWSQALKKQGRHEQSEKRLNEAIEYGRKAAAVAQDHGLKTILANILANVERESGEIDFEKKDYKKAFEHFLNSCHLIAEAAAARGKLAVQLQQRLTENANRLQQKLHTLPAQEEAQYAQQILGWMDGFSEEVNSQLAVLRTFLKETLRLSQYSFAAF
jgi:tetratricopeptide (TPR) repeat protein